MALRPPRSPPASNAAVSAAMRGNLREGTRPELFVRRLLHRLGYRFRIHLRELPGKPDVVFRRRRTAIYVHGCFWHQHADPACPLRSRPRGNAEYWDLKLARNVERDAEQLAALRGLGWLTIVVWECECKDPVGLGLRLTKCLGPPQFTSRWTA